MRAGVNGLAPGGQRVSATDTSQLTRNAITEVHGEGVRTAERRHWRGVSSSGKVAVHGGIACWEMVRPFGTVPFPRGREGRERVRHK